MKKYNPDDLLVSLHIPKTAGSSLRVILEQWFGASLHLHYPGWASPLTKTPLRRGACVHGHFTRNNGSSIRQFYPEVSQVITVMRDPFERTISEWRFRSMLKLSGQEIPEMHDNPDFDTWFNRRVENVMRERVTPTMKHMPNEISPDDAHTSFDQDFVSVGIHERFPETVQLFARLLGKPDVVPPHVNVTNFDDRRDFRAYRSRHEIAFSPDHVMYQTAREKFEKQLAEAGFG